MQRVVRWLMWVGGVTSALGGCGGSAPSRVPEVAGRASETNKTEVSVAPAQELSEAPKRRASQWSFWPLSSESFSPVQILAGPNNSVTILWLANDRPSISDEPADIERAAQEEHSALENFEFRERSRLASTWRHPMRIGAFERPVAASGPEDSVLVVGNRVTGVGTIQDESLGPIVEISTEGVLRQLDPQGKVVRERILPSLWMSSVLHSGKTSFILEHQDDPNAGKLAYDLSLRVVGSEEREVGLIRSGSQVACPIVALPDGGMLVGAPFGVMTGPEQTSQFIWLSVDGSRRFTREVVGATRSFGDNDSLAMAITTTGSVAVAMRCLFETQLQQPDTHPIVLSGTAFEKETHDLCLWQYDLQGRVLGARRIRRLGYIWLQRLLRLPSGELWLVGSVAPPKGRGPSQPRIWRFNEEWDLLGEVKSPQQVDELLDVVLLSNGDVMALVLLKQAAHAEEEAEPSFRYALARIPS